jgi:hypothetical protein
VSDVVVKLQGGGGGINQLTVTNESLVAHGVAIDIQPISGGFMLSWPADEGWILQQIGSLGGRGAMFPPRPIRIRSRPPSRASFIA